MISANLGLPHILATDNDETQAATESQIMEAMAQAAKDKTPERVLSETSPAAKWVSQFC